MKDKLLPKPAKKQGSQRYLTAAMHTTKPLLPVPGAAGAAECAGSNRFCMPSGGQIQAESPVL